MPFENRQIVVEIASPYVGGRIDRLVQMLTGGARDHVTGLFDYDCVSLNGETMRDTWRRLVVADQVQVRFEVGRRYHARPKPRVHRGFAIIHEDREVIVVDKAPELLTVPTERNERFTLVERVSEYLRRSGGGRAAFPVHRLDRGVSGLLVFGKTKEIADQLRDQFAARKPERKYIAIVAGHVAQPVGEFRSYLATDKSLNRFSTDDEEIGQYAETHYRVLDRLRDTTLVEVRLATGRRNQIRVHFAEAGHPVLGDPRYKPAAARHRDWPFQRIALHAQTLGFRAPLTEKTVRLESQLPPEMVRFIVQSQTPEGPTEATSQSVTESRQPRSSEKSLSRPQKKKRSKRK